jgi:exonuclease SbcC
MKPLLLKFAGIGSFPGKVEIDFNKLSAKGIYLIVGQTGAGKTTIFDAMTYALYGKVAAGRENAIISAYKHADKPFIEFTFEDGGVTYVVHREPTPSGKNTQANKQWLRTLDSSGEALSTVTQTRQVNEKVKEIIGLSDAEFMQVILLPQGQFADFLVARSGIKKNILQAIFGTSTYRRIVDKMEKSAQVLRDELEADNQKTMVQWGVIQNAHDTLISNEIFTELPDFKSETEEFLQLATDKATETDNLAKRASEKFADAKSALNQAESEVDRFKKAQELKELEAEHKKLTKVVETATTAVSRHEVAIPIRYAISTRDALIADIKEQAAHEKSARATAQELTSRITITGEAIKLFAENIETASPNTLTRDFAKVNSFVTKLKEKFDELLQIAEQKDELEESVLTNDADEAKKSEELEAIKLEIDDLKKKTTIATEASREIKDVERQIEKLDELIEASNETGPAADIDRATKLRKKCQEKFDEFSRDLRLAQDKRTKQLAGELAAELATGEECPVCGSLEHPKKAKMASGRIDTEALSAKRDEQLALVKDAELVLTQAQESLKAAQENKAKLPPVPEQDALREKFAQLHELSNSEVGLLETLKEQEELEKSLVTQIGVARVKSAEAKTELTALKKRHTTLSKETQAVGSAQSVDDAIAVLDEISEALNRLNDSVTQLTAKEGQLKQASSNISTLLSKSQFSDEHSALNAILNDDALTDARNIIDEAKDRSEKIGKLSAAVGDKPVPKKIPDLEKLQKMFEEESSLNDSAQRINGVVQSAVTQISKAHKQIQKSAPAFAKKELEVKSAETMAKVFKNGTGQAAGDQLDLETWVLRTLFEEVCLVANQQMAILSHNQYSLSLHQEEGGITRSHGGGLDIYVLDSHSGSRPVHSLSGGEKFMASLSLALALAEVVQRHAGGIEVPCLFIDEGFGTLDNKTLDIVMKVLYDIQATGRSIGIVTHVDSMQSDLTIGIRVHKSPRGSTVELVESSES